MKKFVCVLFLLLMTVNSFSQNPFVKKMDNYSDLEVKKIIEESSYWYFGTSNIEILDDNNRERLFKNELKLIRHYLPWANKYSDKYELNLDHGHEIEFKHYGRIEQHVYGATYFPTGLSFDFNNSNRLLVNASSQGKKFEFKDFILFVDGKRMYLRGYSEDNYIEFIIKSYSTNNLSKFDLYSNFDYLGYIKKYVLKNIEKWRVKGEFEKLSDYTARVTEVEIDIKIKQLQEKAINELKDYLWVYLATDSNFKINSYDSENETFIVNSELFGDLTIKVPIQEAPIFKEKFDIIRLINPEFILSDNKLILTKLDFELDSNSIFTYNIKEELNYTNTIIDYNFDKIDINLSQNETPKSAVNIENKTISVGKSAVDINIPINSKVTNRYALIIGNEDYQSMQRTLNTEQNVEFAVNDATVFKEYTINTLGVEVDNITFITNATAAQMAQQIDKVCKILNKLGNKAELIVYYAGHGFPDESTKIPYLIPVDVSASNLEMGIKLSDLYKKIAATNAKKVVVFLDACFTGGGRNSSIVASRGIKVVPKDDVLTGNIVVLTASSGLQSALPYNSEKHGIFSYYLLKKIQESKGDISINELYNYLKDNVSIQSLKINNKEQDPSMNYSQSVEKEYLSWNLKH
jgi:hypothetical protein